MASPMIILYIGDSHRARWNFQTHDRNGFVVLPASTIAEAKSHVQGPEDIAGIVIGDGHDEIREDISFITAIRNEFLGPIIAACEDEGINLALVSAGCTHHAPRQSDVHDVVVQAIALIRPPNNNRQPRSHSTQPDLQ